MNTDELNAILKYCGIKTNAHDYDNTQPDSMDESDSGGFWDLSGRIADEILSPVYDCDELDDMKYQQVKDMIQSLLYNLFGNYKQPKDDDDE